MILDALSLSGVVIVLLTLAVIIWSCRKGNCSG